MKLRISFLAAAVAAVALAAPALAKGPSEAKIAGPGLKGGGIHLKSNGGGDPSSGTPLGALTESGGFFPAAYGQVPDPMLKSRPQGDLGPKYRVEYTVPGPNGDVAKLKQDLYPYAASGPVTYMKPGQEFFDGMKTHGGWYLGARDLKSGLVDAGLPATPPSGGSGSGWAFPWSAVTIAGAALLILGATFVALKRRPRPAGA
jgi:hypothetical protein